MLNETVDFWIVFPGFESERFDMSQLNVLFSRDFSDFRNQVLTVTKGPKIDLPTRCLQALAEALKINASVTNIQICEATRLATRAPRPGVWRAPHAECCHVCQDVMFSTSCDSDKFGCFGGAVVSSFISDRVELSANTQLYDTVCMLNGTLDVWIVFPSFESERFDMSQLNVLFFRGISKSGFDGRHHERDANLNLSLPPGLGRGTEDKRVRHEHPFGTTTRLATRAPRPGVWWAPQNR